MANSVKLSNGDMIDTSGIYDSTLLKTLLQLNLEYLKFVVLSTIDDLSTNLST